MALPAGAYIKRYGYTKAITVGLMLFGVGALMVGAFGSQQQFDAALAGLFTMAAGLTFLETAANPLVTLLGKPETATTRLNLAQSFNGLGAVISVFVGGMILFPNSTTDVASNAIALTPDEIADALSIQAEKLIKPYFFIAIITVSLGRAFWRGWIKLPEIPSSQNTETQDNPKSSNFLNPTEPYLQPNLSLVQQIRSLLTAPNYNLGLLAQFCYVGAQVGVGSFFIRYATTHSHIQESVAATALSAGLLLFMTGRFLGTFLMRFIPAAKLLLIYASICIVLCLFVSLNASAAGMWILILLQFFMSIMFPSIFSLSLGQLKQSPPMASSLLIMSIVGGAIFPLAMGFLSDQSSIQYAYLVPALCFVAVAIFAKRISALAISATTL